MREGGEEKRGMEGRVGRCRLVIIKCRYHIGKRVFRHVSHLILGEKVEGSYLLHKPVIRKFQIIIMRTISIQSIILPFRTSH